MMRLDAHVAREARYEARIEAAFDQAEAHADAGRFDQAREWLSEAEDLAGGLPDAYSELRERWISWAGGHVHESRCRPSAPSSCSIPPRRGGPL